MLWFGEFSMPVGRLASLAKRDCVAYELLQFARAPFATEVERHWIVGDLRFDREPGLGMAEIRLADVVLGEAPGDAPTTRCGYSVPWIPPRASLLSVAE
jgi:inner membrane protein